MVKILLVLVIGMSAVALSMKIAAVAFYVTLLAAAFGLIYLTLR